MGAILQTCRYERTSKKEQMNGQDGESEQSNWKQWKKIKTRYRMLKALGMEHWMAKELACSRKGYWRMAQVLNQIFRKNNSQIGIHVHV